MFSDFEIYSSMTMVVILAFPLTIQAVINAFA